VICEHLERDLDAYVDRELDGACSAALRDHLSGCAACRARVAERQALSDVIRSAPYYPAPESLRALVLGAGGRSTSARRLFTWAAAAMLIVSIGGSIALVRSSAARGSAVVDEVVNAHVRSLLADHLFDVESTDQHTVKPWFLGKLDFAPPVVDLASSGFPLAGGRLEYFAGRQVAALVYQRQKHTINLFVSPDRDDALAAIDARSIRGFHVHHWTHGGMSFWAVSDLNDVELSAFVRMLQAS
jgi:anti-sigma factor RsiW